MSNKDMATNTKQGRRDRVWSAIKAGDRELAMRLADDLARSFREGRELRTFVSLNLDRSVYSQD